MAGIGIGILDALPIFGTGTVLIPWAVLRLAGGLETGAGTHSHLSVCVILCVRFWKFDDGRTGGAVSLRRWHLCMWDWSYSIFWIYTGPLGLLLIEDMVEAWTKEEETET